MYPYCVDNIINEANLMDVCGALHIHTKNRDYTVFSTTLGTFSKTMS